MKTDLQKAFQWARGRYVSGAGPWGKGRPPEPAREALATARKALAALPALEEAAKAAGAALEAQRAIDGRRYAPGMEAAEEAAKRASKAAAAGRAWRHSPAVWFPGYPCQGPRDLSQFYGEEGGPLRNIQEASGFLDHRTPSSFYADPFQDNTCGGFIAQLPSREGRARFVAGYGFSESDNGGATFDLTSIFESDFEGEQAAARRQIGKAYWTPAMEAPGYWAEAAHESARKEAARAAAGMAERAAEKEMEYQEAWQAGSKWARLKEEEEAARKEALAILAERRAARGVNPAAFPAICAALRGKVESILESIQESREERAELASNADYPASREAFTEGASLQSFPDDSRIWRALRALRAGQSGARA